MRENHLDLAQLAERGVTAASVAGMIARDDARTWVAEEGGEIVAFSMADASVGTVYALFVRPEFEGRGHGKALLRAAEDWLFAAGWETIWLQTGEEMHNRAHAVYLAAGWALVGPADHGDVRYEKRRGAVTVRRVQPGELASFVPALAELLVACVEAGASVGFMHPMALEKSLRFWRRVAGEAERGDRALIVAEDDGGTLVGTVQLVLALPENQPHRADVAKMLVHPTARRRGVARRMLAAVDDVARSEGRTLLVLDTVTGSAAERLYASAGWQRAGEIPGYALMPDGAPCSTTVFYREVPSAAGRKGS